MDPLNSLQGKTVLVTGAAGFIGTHLVRALRECEEANIVLLTRKEIKEEYLGATVLHSSLENLTREIWTKAGLNFFDLVFHLGAFTPKTGSEANLVDPIFADNLSGTWRLLESLPQPPGKIIFASTIDVYAMPSSNILIDERSPAIPATLYGASKLFCEKLVEKYAIKSGCSYAILRLGHIFGPGEKSYHKFIPNTIRSLIQNQSPIIYGDGSSMRDFLYVGDAVEAILRASASKNPRLGPVNIVRGESVSLQKTIEILINVVGFSGERTYDLKKSSGYSLHFNNRLMKEALGRWALVSLEKGLKEEVTYFQEMTEWGITN